ncbi:transposase family protein [Roseovarius sp.]|uniref:transposase family protein n=1 Tax=Roseovarius sp. TaxID=1486281 RepID=UPI00338EE8DF
MDRRAFLPGGLKVELVDDRVLIHARPPGGAAACPRCGEISRRVQSHYERRLADLPAHGRQVRLVLSTRRFRCNRPVRTAAQATALAFLDCGTQFHGSSSSRRLILWSPMRARMSAR